MKTWPLLLPLLLAACTQRTDAPAGGVAAPAPVKITNRVDIPKPVIDNLGITFVKVEKRHVARILRVPGVFECPPEAARAYATPLAGRLTLLVKQYQGVDAGTPLFRLESPELLRMAREIAAADAQAAGRAADAVVARAESEALQRALLTWPARIEALNAQIAASDDHAQKLHKAAEIWADRLAQLEGLDKAAGGQAAAIAEARSRKADSDSALSDETETRAGYAQQLEELKATQSADNARVPVLTAQAEKAHVETEAAKSHAALVRHELATLLNVPASELAGEAWRKIDGFTQKAEATGIVTELSATNGEHLAAGAPVLRTLNNTMVRFRGRGMQSDLGRLDNGLDATIVPPTGGALANAAPVAGKLRLAPEADADHRTMDILVLPTAPEQWARPGVSAEAEIVWDKTAEPVTAIPLACVVRDELQRIFFRRDPNDPNKAIRIAGNFGIDDGRWIVVNEGVLEGDEIVLSGVYELKLTGSGKPTGAGHFHADGTWHDTSHGEKD